jgi:predicted nuclease of predicted toxin-antitoxin system
MRLVIDVSLSPEWVDAFRAEGIDAVHWTTVGDARAKDREIIDWAREQGCIVFTHDLDFGAILALTHAAGPSVIQLRAQDVLPAAIGTKVTQVIAAHRVELEKGAIVTVDDSNERVRILPILGRSAPK